VSKRGKGRKRLQTSNKLNLRQMIESQVIPQWVAYLKRKMDASEGESANTGLREDTVWKKIFRDLREFFRILFRQRFHPLDYKTCKQADRCTTVLLNELGVSTDHLTSYEVRKAFYFMHQTRLSSSDHYISEYVEGEDEIFALDIIEKYGDSIKTLFMIDSISSKLFYTVFYNFDYLYYTFMKPKYKLAVSKVISRFLN
jgi:hypothetical protein